MALQSALEHKGQSNWPATVDHGLLSREDYFIYIILFIPIKMILLLLQCVHEMKASGWRRKH